MRKTRQIKVPFLFPDQQGWWQFQIWCIYTHDFDIYYILKIKGACIEEKTCQIIVPFLFPDQQGSGSATKGVFTYFFWVLLQPFRGNPEYHDVADLPYNSSCLNDIKTDRTDMRSLSKFLSSHMFNNQYVTIIINAALSSNSTKI